jgi:hypothetical protein
MRSSTNEGCDCISKTYPTPYKVIISLPRSIIRPIRTWQSVLVSALDTLLDDSFYLLIYGPLLHKNICRTWPSPFVFLLFVYLFLTSKPFKPPQLTQKHPSLIYIIKLHSNFRWQNRQHTLPTIQKSWFGDSWGKNKEGNHMALHAYCFPSEVQGFL